MHLMRLCFSETYRENLEYEQGEKLWLELNLNLPVPLGVEKEDENRVKLFAECFQKNLTSKEQALLVKWMRERLYRLEHDTSEDLSHAIIEYEQKWAAIYRQHLAAVL